MGERGLLDLERATEVALLSLVETAVVEIVSTVFPGSAAGARGRGGEVALLEIAVEGRGASPELDEIETDRRGRAASCWMRFLPPGGEGVDLAPGLAVCVGCPEVRALLLDGGPVGNAQLCA